MSTADWLDSVQSAVQDVETVWVVAATLLLAASAPRLDPHHLPALPNRGLIRQERAGVALETLRGAPLGRLAGFQLASRIGIHGALLEDARHRLYVIDVVERRIRQVFPMGVRAPPGCHFTDAISSVQLYVCGRTIKSAANGHLRVVARAPSPEGGGWHWAEYARPTGPAILAQWYGLCESPTAFSTVGGKLHP